MAQLDSIPLSSPALPLVPASHRATCIMSFHSSPTPLSLLAGPTHLLREGRPHASCQAHILIVGEPKDGVGEVCVQLAAPLRQGGGRCDVRQARLVGEHAARRPTAVAEEIEAARVCIRGWHG